MKREPGGGPEGLNNLVFGLFKNWRVWKKTCTSSEGGFLIELEGPYLGV